MKHVAELPDSKDIWHYAREESRDYVTPEDIQAAINASETRDDHFEIMRAVLRAIEKKSVEDVNLSSFVAHRLEKDPDSENGS